MLADLHAHSSGISKCCRIPFEEVINQARRHGMECIVLTNHYQKSYIEDGDAIGFAKRYIEEYHKARDYGKTVDFTVIFGIEVTMEKYPAVHMLIYGVPEEFLLENPCVFDLTQEELYELVKSYGGILVQAHPFRNGATVLDVNFLDGIEINCHPLYKKSYAEELIKIAEENNLALTCGGDFHADTYRPQCGMYLPDCLFDTFELAKHILYEDEITLCIHEPDADSTYKYTYTR